MRKHLIMMAFLQVLGGPVQNLLLNIKEIRNSASCFQIMIGNVDEFVRNKVESKLSLEFSMF